MRFARAAWVLPAALLAAASSSAAAAAPKRPRLELRVMPRMGPPSTEFLFVADLKGGDEAEDFYCLTLEWQWGRAENTSVHEPECPPFQPGVTRIERRFSHSRAFPDEGQRDATLVLRKGDKVVARASASFRVTWEKSDPNARVRVSSAKSGPKASVGDSQP